MLGNRIHHPIKRIIHSTKWDLFLEVKTVRASLVAPWRRGKESACNAGDVGSIPGLGRSPGEGNSNQLQYSCLENHMDKEAWQATVHEVARVMRLLRHDLATKPPPILMARAVPTM